MGAAPDLLELLSRALSRADRSLPLATRLCQASATVLGARSAALTVAPPADGRLTVATAAGRAARLLGARPAATAHAAVARAVGAEVTPDTPDAELHALCARLGIEVGEDETHGAVVNEMYDRLVEGQTVEPTFYTDFPVESSPLTRVHRREPRLGER